MFRVRSFRANAVHVSGGRDIAIPCVLSRLINRSTTGHVGALARIYQVQMGVVSIKFVREGRELAI